MDLTFISEKTTDVKSVNAALKAAAEGELKGILGYDENQLVSSDFKGDKRSSIVDASSDQGGRQQREGAELV